MKQKVTCNQYDAINKANLLRPHLIYSGIGAGACSRQGCFVPHCVVNFQRGERSVVDFPCITLHLMIPRQMNMDYCVSEALKFNTKGIKRSILLYDIMCQFWKNLQRRFRGNPYLSFPHTMEVLRGIGLFHVHGHKDECYGRFAPTFIPGAGMVDGEVLETLWAVLNGIADSIRSQSTAHRQESLDDHMNDSNWKKMIQLIYRLCKKYKKAVDSAKASQIDFSNINDSADPEVVAKWSEQEMQAQQDRDEHEEAMDIYDIKISKGEQCFNMTDESMSLTIVRPYQGQATSGPS